MISSNNNNNDVDVTEAEQQKDIFFEAAEHLFRVNKGSIELIEIALFLTTANKLVQSADESALLELQSLDHAREISYLCHTKMASAICAVAEKRPGLDVSLLASVFNVIEKERQFHAQQLLNAEDDKEKEKERKSAALRKKFNEDYLPNTRCGHFGGVNAEGGPCRNAATKKRPDMRCFHHTMY